MNDKILAIKNNDGLCYKCLNIYDESKINIIEIEELGYGSGFDGFSSKLQLCDTCKSKTNSQWWKLKVLKNKENNFTYEYYEFEKEILEYIEELPLQSQELFYNENGYGSTANYKMDSQDWIDYELNLLSHEKCKEYGLYSLQERQAYYDRFPTCGEVFLKIYSDNSSGCYCKYGASGNKDGSCNENISIECYQCSHYIPKQGSMKIINEMDEFVKHETQRLKEMLNYATKNLKLIEKDPKKYRQKFE